MKPSQKKQIREHLEKGLRLTQIGALTLFGCFRLSHVIWKLKKEGMDIDKDMIRTAPSKFSKKGKFVASYYLKRVD